MIKIFYSVYQYFAPLIILPFSFYLWFKEIPNFKYVILILSFPIIISYIIPAIGTNVTKVWEFKTKHMIGKFRVYHGFVFGGFTSLLGFCFYAALPSNSNNFNILIWIILCSSFLSFINTIYDINAVKTGFLIIHNRAFYEQKSSYEIVFDYAPIFFFVLGVTYTLFLKYVLYSYFNTRPISLIVLFIFYISGLLLPTIFYSIFHYMKYRQWGLLRYKPNNAK